MLPIAMPQRALLTLLALAAVMLATRFHHFLPVADASWAVFFVGGYLLARQLRWAFPALMALAITIDWIATSLMGVSSYCLSAAYPFLVPAYFALWMGGAWLQGRSLRAPATAGHLLGALVGAVTIAFLISDASFYWFSPVVADRSVDGWLTNAARWYPGFLQVTTLYVALASTVLILIDRLQPQAAQL